MEESILFLGKFDNKLLELEEKVITTLEELLIGRSDFYLEYNESGFPDVIKHQVNNCNIWSILGDVKPTLLLKDLISKTKVVLFIFNLTNLETLEFLREGWGPIIKKVDQNKPYRQTRILIGTQSEPTYYTDNLVDKISSTMEFLNCCAYLKEEINSKPTIEKETIGQYPILPNLKTLIYFIKDQISTEFMKPHKDIDKYNGNKEPKNEGRNYNNDEEDEKISIKIKNILFLNLFKKSQTAEIVKIQNIRGNFRIPTSVNYKRKEYKIINICDYALKNSIITDLSFDKNSEIKTIGDYAFQKSRIQQLSIPSSLEKLGKNWCADANKLIKIEVDKSNKHFSMLRSFLIFKNGPISEILFAPQNINGKFSIPEDFSIGNYAFSSNNGLQVLVSKGSHQHLDIGDHSFYGAQNLQEVTLDSKELNIGDCCFQKSPELQSIKITSNKLNIGNGSFVDCASLKTIIFNKIETAKICSNAFVGCKSLEEFKITSSNLEIGERCFFDAISLKEIEIIGKESLIIGENCFENCKSLSSILLENENDPNMKIPENAFNGCQSLTKIILKCNSTIKLNKNLFRLTNKLETFSITCNEIIIGNQFFSKCFNRQGRIYIKSKNKIEFEDNCFESSNIEKVEIEGKELIFMRECFKKCTNLKTIQISNASQIFIDEFSFDRCTKLVNISLKNIGCINILPNAFNRCIKLQKIDLESTSRIDINQFCFCNFHNFESALIMNGGIFTFDLFFRRNSSSISFCENKLNEKQYKYKSFTRFKYKPKLTIESHNYYLSDINELVNNDYSDEHEPISNNDTKSESTNTHSINSRTSKIVKTDDNSEEDEIFVKNEKYEQINDKGIIYNYSIDNRTAEIVKAQNINDYYIVPQFINISNKGKFIITKICDKAFEKSSIKTLSFQENSEIKTIGNYAFRNSQNLQKVKLESKEINIGERCFSNINKLKKVELIGKESFNIGERCFENCTSLSSVSFINKSDKNMTILKNTLVGCESLKSITIGSNSTIILDSKSFANNNKLETVSIIGNEIIIGNKCFYGCFNKEKYEYNFRYKYETKKRIEKSLVIRSKSKIELRNNCFENSYIESIQIEGKELNIKKKCFKNCENLKEFLISDISRISIDEFSFNMCQNLKRISFENIDDIAFGQNAFNQCKTLETIEIKSKSKTYIDNSCFSTLKNLQTISIKCEDIYIGESCFQDCTNLSTILFYNAKIITLSKNAFFGCSKLQNILINSIIKKSYYLKQEIEFSTTTIDQIYISESCFQNCINIPTISFYNVKNIKLCKNAFFGCIKLQTFLINSLFKNNYYGTNQSIEFSSVTADKIYIGESCFQKCDQLSSIIFGNASQTKLLHNAFLGCKSLKEFKLASSKLEIGNNCFSGVSKLQVIELICQNSLIIGESCFENCTSLSSILFGNASQTKLLHNAFLGCKSLKEFKLTSSKLEIGNNCFSGASKLQAIELICQNGLIIGENCFENCTSLSSIILQNESEKDMKISNNAFNGCNSITSVTLKNKTIQNLNKELFPKPNKIKKLTIIGDEVFINDKFFDECFDKNIKIDNYSFNKNTLIIESKNAIELGNNCFENAFIEKVAIKGEELIIKKESFKNCLYLTTILISDTTRVFLDEYSFSGCANLLSISLKNIGYISIQSNSFYECNHFNNIELQLSKDFDIQNYFEVMQSLSDATYNKSFKLRDKRTNEFLVAKSFGFSNYQIKGINQIIPLLKESNAAMPSFYAFCLFHHGSDSFISILTEYYTNGTLEEAFKSKKLTGTQRHIILLGITLGIQYFNSKNINNQNLTPSQIFLDDLYYPKLNNIKISNSTTYMSSRILESDFNSFLQIMNILINGESTNKYQVKQLNYDDALNKQIQNFLMSLNDHRFNFDKIFDEITKDYFFKFFKSNEKEISKYIYLFGIELKEEVNYDDITYKLYKQCHVADIVKANDVNGRFQIPKCILHNGIQYNITKICDHAFFKSQIKSISFAKDSLVTSIGNYTFTYTNLTDISIPASIEKIGSYCFAGLENIKNIYFECSTLSIGESCFEGCTSLASISFPKTKIVKIESNCFKGCINLTVISTMRKSNVELGESCFSGLKNLSAISFQCESLKISQKCFENCKSLTSFKCETYNPTISQQIFNGCDKLESISITQSQSNSIENEKQNSELILSENWFNNLKSLKTFDIEIIQSIIIKSNPFKQCQSLSEVRFQSMNSVVFETKSFYQGNIKSFEVIGKQVDFGENCFSFSYKLQSMKIKCDELSIAKYCFYSCIELSSISFQNLKCAKIDSYSFYYCNKLTELELSTSTNLEINQYSFYNMKGLRKISLTTRKLIIENKTFNKSNDKDVNKSLLRGLDAQCSLNIHFI